MHVWSIIAALAAAHLAQPAMPVRAASPVVHAVATARASDETRASLVAAIEWFAVDVARPLLLAKDQEELFKLYVERAELAAQARMAIVNALDAVLREDPAALAAVEQVDSEVSEELHNAGTTRALRLAWLLDVAAVDLLDFQRFELEHSVSMEQRRAAYARLVPLATGAEVPLLVALLGVYSPLQPRADVMDALVGMAEHELKRQRAALHETLRDWDPTWEPTLEAPAWADHPTELALSDRAIDKVVEILRNPPPPNAALLRAMKRT